MRHLASPRKVAVAGIVAAVLLTAATAAAADSNEYRRFPNPPPDPARCTMTPVDVTVAVAAATATPVTIPLEGAEPVLVARGLAADFADFVNVGTPQVGDLFASLPAAPPADRAAITALETEFAACRNTGDFRRWFAFYTPTLQREIVAALGDQVADFFRPDSLSLDDWVPVNVGPVVDLGDGRLAALVDFCDDRWVRVYVREGGSWRIAGQAAAPERPGEATHCAYPDPGQPPSLEALP